MRGHHREMRLKQLENEETGLNRQTAIQYLLSFCSNSIKKGGEGSVKKH